MTKTTRKRNALLGTAIALLAVSLIFSNILILPFPVAAADTDSTFILRGASVTANCFVPTAKSYYLNAWNLLQSAGVNWIRVGGGTEGDVNHFNMKNYPNEWAKNLDNFLAQAAAHGIKVSFGSLGNAHDTLFGIRSPGSSFYSDPNAEYTSIDQAKAMIDQLAGNNSLNHNFITDDRVVGWVTSNEVYIGPSTSSNPNMNGPLILDWNIQLLDYIRSKGGKAWMASPTVIMGSTDGYDFEDVVPLIADHVDYLEAHYYKEWELLNYYLKEDGTCDWEGFQAFYKNLLINDMVAVRGNFPIEHVILGEFGIWLGAGSDVGVSHTFNNKDRQNYYQAVLTATQEAGIVNICQHEFFEQANIALNKYALVNLATKYFFPNDAADKLLPAYGLSSVYLLTSTSNASLGSSVTLSGAITPTATGATISLSIRPIGGSWSTLSAVSVDADSKFAYTWTCSTSGSYEVKASWAGSENAPASDSNTVTVDVFGGARTLSINAFPSDVAAGESVTVTGSVSPASTGVSISLYWSSAGGSWTFLAQVQADLSGFFSYRWYTTNAGTYQVKAVIAADSTGNAAESSPYLISVQTSIPENPSATALVTLSVFAALISAMLLILADINKNPKRSKTPKNA